MPYIIEMTEPQYMEAPHVTRVAVATLDEAREEAFRAAVAYTRTIDLYYREAADALPAEGGTIGPLPDGTVIEVQLVGWWELGEKSGLPGYPALDAHRKIIDAYNAR